MTLARDEVHVWLAMLEPLAPLLQVFLDSLSADERERAERFHFRKDRDQYVLGRGVLRDILSRYLGTTAAALRFSYGGHGKPTLDFVHNSRLQFNLSHADGVAIYALAHTAVGIDVEYLRRAVEHEEIARHFFCAGENSVLQSLFWSTEAFFRCWTRKEAYVKLRGEGLSLSLGSFNVAAGLREESLLLNPETGPDAALGCCFQELPVPSDYVATLAVQPGPGRLQYWCWHDHA